MATLRNKHVSSVKNSIGIFLAGSGTSVTGINSIAGMGLSSTYQTVYNQIKDILNNHNTSVCNYIQENSNNLFILNIDDYHNLHQSRIPSTTSISQVSHMATILINYVKTSPVSYNFNSEFNVHNINGVDAGLLNQWLNKKYMNIISESYYQRKTKWNFVKDLTTMDEDNLIDSLVLHSYDADLTEKHSKRSFNSTKLIEFLPQDLINTNDYLKSLGEFFSLVRRHTTAKVLSPEWLRRDGIFVDYLRHDNNFAQSFAEKKSYPYSKKNIDVLVKQTAIFLLKFFNNLWNNLGTVEIRSEGKKIKKPYWYFPGIAKGFIKGALPLGYHTKQIPCKTGCDYNECKNSQTNIDAVFPCGHEMDGNIGDEFDSPQDETIEEDDTNIPETISLGDKLDECLHKTLRDFIENKPLDIFQPINKNKTSTVKKQKKQQKPLKTITNCYQEQT
ncbi:unnamed protein product [Rhizophagus irregularis]|nr:unnamed protein product [Rhizophagus irregularis]